MLLLMQMVMRTMFLMQMLTPMPVNVVAGIDTVAAVSTSHVFPLRSTTGNVINFPPPQLLSLFNNNLF
jgi:hypothetical protein